jgi:tRNA(fMet)-specific endonuclease VapC
MIYLLDSNVWITFLRKPLSPVVTRLQALQPHEVRVCSVVAAELYLGCLRSAKPADSRAKIKALLQPYASLPFDDAAAEHYVNIRHHLETLGMPIGPYDLQIAAIALANNCTLVSHNTREFSRVPGLLLEDWEMP